MRFSNLLIFLLVAFIASIVAVANRQIVTFSLDPLSANYPSIAFTLPLYLLVFMAILFGVLLGAASVALRRTQRRRARQLAPVGDDALATAEPRSIREAASPHGP